MTINDPLIGQHLGGCEIIELVGRGGMGSVYRARDESLRRDIAIKVLRFDDIAEEREADRFRREAQLAAGLSHPNIVAIHSTGSEAGYLYLAMEMVEGQSLRALLRRNKGPLAIDAALSIVQQLLDALGLAHQRGIIHRDIKPENVIVKEDGTIKVLDFGVAKLEGGTVLTRADEILGTVEYMAPEQILGDGVGAASDLYAVGVLFYELVTGALPFSGESAATLVYHQLNQTPPAPSLLNPLLPRALDRFVIRLLDKQPENRYGSAADALDALDEVRRRQRVVSVPGFDTDDEGEVEDAEELETRDFRFRFTGRQQEIDGLKSRFEQAAQRGRLVFISGEAGIGKTRVVEELTRDLEGRGERVFRGNCFYEHGMGPYMPFLDAIGDLFGKERNGLNSDERAELADLLRQQAPALAELATRSSTTARVRAGFASAFGDASDPQAARQRLFDAVFELFAAAAVRRPMTIVLEDMHWADEGTLQMLQSLVHRSDEARILWIATYRPEEIGDDSELASLLNQLHAEDRLDEITLPRLARDPLLSMVKSLFAAAEFSADFDDFIYGQSQGNPLVAAEVLKMLHTRDILYCDSGVWTVRDGLRDIVVPDRISALVQQRLDQLDEQAYELLQVAAVIGQHFRSDILELATGQSRIALLKALFRLEKRNRLIASQEGLYEFGHSVIREVIYSGITDELRREYHAIVAEALETLQERGEEINAEALGNHLYEAGHKTRAFPFLQRFATEAFQLFDWRHAAVLLDRAADAGQDDRASAEDLLYVLHQGTKAHLYLNDYEKATARCEQLRALAQAQQDPVREAEAWKLVGNINDRQRKTSEADAAFAHALELLSQQSEPVLTGQVLQDWGCVDFENGRYQQAEERWRQSLEFLQEAPGEMANLLNNMAVAETMHGHLEEAWALYERVLALDNDAGPKRVITLWNMGMLRADEERWDDALELYDLSLDLCQRTRYFYHQPSIELNKAEALLGQGNLVAGRKTCGKALRGFRRLDDALGVADALRIYGKLCRLEENWEESAAYLEQSLELNRSFGQSVSLGEALYELGVLERDRGHRESALASLREAESIFSDIAAEPDLERTRAALIELEYS